jgi:AcrR family transcriptional regulator
MKPARENSSEAQVPGRAEKAAFRREAILNAALDAFTKQGFAATRMEDIARRAGVAKGTIYLNFKDKEALFLAIVQQEIGPVVATAASALAPGESVHAFLERTILPLLTDLPQSRRGAVLRLLIAEAGRFPNLAEVYYCTIIERGLAVFSKLIRRALKNGELQDHTLARFPQLLIAPVILGVVWTGLFERFHHLDVESMARTYFDQLFLRQPTRSKPSKRHTKNPAR